MRHSTTIMAEHLALHSVRTMAVRMLLRPTTASLNIRRMAGGNATASVSPGHLRTKADLSELSLSTIMYRMIFQGFYNRMHELQVQYAQQSGLFSCGDVYFISLLVILILDRHWNYRLCLHKCIMV